MQEAGIYVIENLVTGHRYVGSAVKLEKRRREHFGALRRGDHRSVVLQRAFNKHGDDALRFRPLLICSPGNLLFYEQRAIDTYCPEYNVCKTAGSRLGAKYTDEARVRLSELRKAQPRSPAQLAHLKSLSDRARGQPGRSLPADVRDKIAATLRGRPADPEVVARRAATFKGFKHSDETRARMSEAKRKYWANKRVECGTEEV